MQTPRHRPLVAAALSLLLALPALADPGTIEQELTAHMVRVDRGKKNLDKASRSKVVAIKLSSLEKASLALRRARTALREKEGIAFEALAEEAETLLVRTYNLTARIHLARQDLTKAREANALALAVNREGEKAKEIAKTIRNEEASRFVAPVTPEGVPPTAQRIDPESGEVLPEGEVLEGGGEAEKIVYVVYVPYDPYDRYDRYDSYIGLGYSTYGYSTYGYSTCGNRTQYRPYRRASTFGISYRGRRHNTAFKAHVGHLHGGSGRATSGTYRGRRTPTNGYNFRAAGRGAFKGNGRTPKMNFSAGNNFGVFQRNTTRSYGPRSTFGTTSRGAGRGAFRGPRTTGWGN